MVDIVDKTLTINDVETHIKIGGTGAPLLFLHGFSLGNLWLPFHDQLAEHFTVYAPDHPGAGLSGMPDWFDTMDDMVLHYISLLNELQLDKVTVVGLSFGGWLAAELASFYPERIDHLVLLAAAGLRVPNSPVADLFAMSPEQLFSICFQDLSHAMALMSQIDMSDPIKLILADYRERTMLARLAWNPGYSPKLARRLARVTAPSLVIWGKEDRLIPAAHGTAYQAALPNARLEIIEDCGHIPILEATETTIKLIQEFLSQEQQ